MPIRRTSLTRTLIILIRLLLIGLHWWTLPRTVEIIDGVPIAYGDIAARRAAMLPSVTLTGGAEPGSERLRRVFDNPLYSLAAGLLGPIFNAGRLTNRNLSMAQREELLADDRLTLVAALGDVEASLNPEQGLDAQRTLYTGQDTAVQLKALRLQVSVSLYKALGGGWSLQAVDAVEASGAAS